MNELYRRQIMKEKKCKLSTIENYAIGAITGLAEVAISNPLIVIKTNRQQKNPIPWSFRGLYAGAFVNALGFMPITAIQVGANNWLQARIFNNHPTYIQQMGAAFSAGVLSSFISCPVEMVMALQNDNNKASLASIVKSRLQNKGFFGFFYGQLATSSREGVFSVCFLEAPRLIKPKLTPYFHDDTTATILSGVCSGIGATLITHPFDTIKAMQQSPKGINLGFFKTAKSMTMHSAYQGVLARSGNVILAITFMNWMKEKLEGFCEEYGESIYGGSTLK